MRHLKLQIKILYIHNWSQFHIKIFFSSSETTIHTILTVKHQVIKVMSNGRNQKMPVWRQINSVKN